MIFLGTTRSGRHAWTEHVLYTTQTTSYAQAPKYIPPLIKQSKPLGIYINANVKNRLHWLTLRQATWGGGAAQSPETVVYSLKVDSLI